MKTIAFALILAASAFAQQADIPKVLADIQIAVTAQHRFTDDKIAMLCATVLQQQEEIKRLKAENDSLKAEPKKKK